MQNELESDLLESSLRGDADAYGILVDRYKNALYHHCFAIAKDEDVAEDIAQDTFIAAFYALTKYDAKKGKFSTWLFTISTRRALDWIKKNSRTIAATDAMLMGVVSTAVSPENHAKYNELHEAVRCLQPKHQTVLSLYYWQGLSIADIALVMAAPQGSVKVWLKRAKESLRKELA